MEYSPALSVSSNTSDMTEEEMDQYFASYVPLSSLPTPPPAKVVTIPCTVEDTTAVIQAKTPELEAHAIHLSKLIPCNTASQPASIATISGFLLRANLPTEVLAFTACILDALSHRFASSWRAASVPSAPTQFNYIQCRPLGPVRSEIIVLAALSLAHGWLEDRPRSNSYWACVAGASEFTSAQVETARRCILRDMDYGLFRINQDMVRFMTEKMQWAANGSLPRAGRVGGVEKKMEDKRPKLSLDMSGTGTATWKFGMITPEPSP